MEIYSKRDEYFDILRGIGIICVVLGHVLNQNYGNSETEIVRKFIYVFHLPLFFFISGYFIKKEEYVSFLIKKIKTLYIPCITISLFSIILVPLWVRFGILKSPSINMLFHKVIKIFFFKADGYFVGACWFFSLLFISVLLFELILQTDSYIAVCIISSIEGILGIICINMNILDVQNFNIAFAMQPFILMGYIAKGKGCDPKKADFRIALLFASAILVLNTMTGFEVELSEGKVYGDGILFYPVAFMGIYLSCVCAKWINMFKFKKMFAYIGRHSNIIMMFHFIAFKIVDIVLSLFLINGNIENTIFGFQKFRWLYFIMGIALPLLFDKYLYFFKDKTKRWLVGKYEGY